MSLVEGFFCADDLRTDLNHVRLVQTARHSQHFLAVTKCIRHVSFSSGLLWHAVWLGPRFVIMRLLVQMLRGLHQECQSASKPAMSTSLECSQRILFLMIVFNNLNPNLQ